jgi:hypothetical protein
MRGLFNQKGAWIYFGDNDEMKWQGWDKLREELASNEELRTSLKAKIGA